MPHPRELLDAIAADIARSWPAAKGYRMIFERPLRSVRTMLPDIQVVDEGGAVHCVVEVGYTRPEKLTRYRALGIPDVRWYAKDGTLHLGGDVGHSKFRPAPPRAPVSLSARQAEVLAYVRAHIADHGYAPTILEIGAALGLRSTATVHKHLAKLEAKGLIVRTWNHTRAIQLTEAA